VLIERLKTIVDFDKLNQRKRMVVEPVETTKHEKNPQKPWTLNFLTLDYK